MKPRTVVSGGRYPTRLDSGERVESNLIPLREGVAPPVRVAVLRSLPAGDRPGPRRAGRRGAKTVGRRPVRVLPEAPIWLLALVPAAAVGKVLVASWRTGVLSSPCQGAGPFTAGPRSDVPFVVAVGGGLPRLTWRSRQTPVEVVVGVVVVVADDVDPPPTLGAVVIR